MISKILNSLIEQSSASVLITDLQGTIEYVNPQFTHITGYEPEEVIGKNPRILKSGEQPYDVYVHLWATITAGYEWKGRFHNKKKNGELYWELMSISPIKDDNGNITHFAAVKIDDTERLKAEEEARKCNERLAAILQMAGDAIISVDENKKIIVFNKEAERVFNYLSGEIVGKPLNIILPDKVRDNHNFFIEVFTKSEIISKRIEKKQSRIVGLRKNGSQFPAEVSISKLDEGRNLIFTAVVRDITKRLKIEEELRDAQKLETLGTLAGGIAHDFNNILTAIMGNASLAKMITNPEDKVYNYIKCIEDGSFRARDLTQQLLTFSRGGLPVKKTASIVELIKESATFMLRGSNVNSSFSIPDDIWPVDVNIGQINQVINNIVINANQAMPDGGTITISVRNISEKESIEIKSLTKGRYIMISFKDQGVGISEENLPKIFGPYFTTKQTGNGLGLAASYSIIKKHDGHISLKSKLGQGTTFFIYLPASSKQLIANYDSESSIYVGKGRVLVMDDDESVRESVKTLLSHIGYEVELTGDGNEAIDLYKKSRKSCKPFDVVMMDLTIPGTIGGREAIKKLRKVDPNVKAIAFSGYSNDPILSNFKEYGFNGVISKPFVIDELSRVVRNCFSGSNLAL